MFKWQHRKFLHDEVQKSPLASVKGWRHLKNELLRPVWSGQREFLGLFAGFSFVLACAIFKSNCRKLNETAERSGLGSFLLSPL